MTYREVAKLNTGLKQARALAIGPDGAVYVGGDTAVLNRDGEGFALAATLSETPHALAVTKDAMYVGLLRRVVVLDRAGRTVAEWPALPEKAMIASLAVRGKEVWVGDAGQRAVLHYTTDGKLVGRIDGYTVFTAPRLDVAFAPDGKLWTANPGEHRLEQRGADGVIARQWGTPSNAEGGFGGCCNPADFALMSEGRFLTAEKGVPRIRVHTADGALEAVVAGPETLGETNHEGFDVAVDGNGRIYALDRRDGMLRLYEKRTDR
jgi:hypothetical protein